MLGHDIIGMPRSALELTCREPPEQDRGRYERLIRQALRAEAAGRMDEAIDAWALARSAAQVAWSLRWTNLVTMPARNDVGEVYLRGGTQKSSWYVGLCGYVSGTTFTPQTTDTLASHPGWSEITTYDNTQRQLLVLSPFSAGAASNQSAPVSFAMNANFTVVGAFTSSIATKNGTGGILLNVVGNSGTVNQSGAGSTLTGVMSLTMSG